MHAPRTLGWVFTFIFIAQFVPATAWMLHTAWRRRTIVPVLAILGGLAAGFGESMLDTLTELWWPVNIPLTAYRGFGVHVPLYALLGYSLFLGFGCYLVFDLIRRGKGAQWIWAVAGAFFVADLLYEVPFTSLNLYRYYGPQPFRLGGFPLYWAFLNAMAVIVGGWMFHAVAHRLHGWRSVAAFAIPIMALGPLMGAGWPVFSTLHMNVAAPLRWLTALFAMAVSVWLVTWVASTANTASTATTAASASAGPVSVSSAGGSAGSAGARLDPAVALSPASH
jgi:hypothetical protein